MDFNKIFFLHIILLSTLFSCNNSNSNGNNFDSNAENKFTLNNAELTGGFSYVSIAGGALVEWLEGKKLPGLLFLEN